MGSKIITDRLAIRALTRSEMLKIYRKDLSGFRRAGGWPLRELVEALPHFINDISDDPDSRGWNAYIIKKRTDSTIIGDIGFKGPPDEEGNVEVGYSIAPGHRNMGYALEALSGMLEHAKETKKVRFVIAECSVDNPWSARVLEKAGFSKTHRKNNMIHWQIDLQNE